MFNDIHIGPITFHMYGLMIAIGFVTALYVAIYRGKKKGLREDIFYGIFYCAIIGGALGSRILYYIVEIPHIINDPSILWNFKVGYVVYGGIIGGILASYRDCRVEKVNVLEYFDLVMPEVSLAQGFGRLGCFFAGCCYGRPTDAWYGITFTHSQMAPNGVSLIPTQLISSAADFIFAAVLMFYASKSPKKGRVASMYMVLYGIGRFSIEFLRNDYRGSVGILSTSQFISIAVVAIGLIIYVMVPKLQSSEPEVEDEKEVKQEE